MLSDLEALALDSDRVLAGDQAGRIELARPVRDERTRYAAIDVDYRNGGAGYGTAGLIGDRSENAAEVPLGKGWDRK
jgi:hypothetical protein